MPNGFSFTYGQAFYGEDIYGEVVQFVPAPANGYTEQAGYCPKYLRFQISGINMGLYVFDINPTSYDGFPQRTTQSYRNILGFDPTVDKNYDKIEIDMSFEQMPESMWNSLLPYSRKKVDGTSEDLYLWDSHAGRFQGNKMRIEAMRGEVKGGYFPIDRFNVSMKIRVALT